MAVMLRVEGKLDALIEALAEEPEDQPLFALDGSPMGGERDTGAPL